MNVNKLRLAAIGTVMVIAFYISYFDLKDVAEAIKISGMGRQFLFPFIIDGTILASTFTLLAKTGLTKVARSYANGARWVGFVLTIGGNAAHATGNTMSIIGNVAVAVVLILTIETMVHAAAGTNKKVQLTPAQKAAKTRATNRLASLKVAKVEGARVRRELAKIGK